MSFVFFTWGSAGKIMSIDEFQNKPKTRNNSLFFTGLFCFKTKSLPSFSDFPQRTHFFVSRNITGAISFLGKFFFLFSNTKCFVSFVSLIWRILNVPHELSIFFFQKHFWKISKSTMISTGFLLLGNIFLSTTKYYRNCVVSTKLKPPKPIWKFFSDLKFSLGFLKRPTQTRLKTLK